MRRLIAKTVFSGLVMLCRLAVWPTRTSPLSVKATREGVVRAPSAFSINLGVVPSMTATQELVVPRSIPIALAMTNLLLIAYPKWPLIERASHLPRPARHGTVSPSGANVRRGAQERVPDDCLRSRWSVLRQGGAPGTRPRAASQAASLTSIFLGSLRAGFGMVIFNTPFDMEASIFDGSTPGGS